MNKYIKFLGLGLFLFNHNVMCWNQNYVINGDNLHDIDFNTAVLEGLVIKFAPKYNTKMSHDGHISTILIWCNDQIELSKGRRFSSLQVSIYAPWNTTSFRKSLEEKLKWLVNSNNQITYSIVNS